jgi:plastocyanin
LEEILKKALFVALALAALGLAGPAGAATYQVAVGEIARPPAGTPDMATLNQFFPSRLVIHAGDKVTFTNFGFHTVTYVKGGGAAPLFVPDGSKYAALNDAAGTPFGFSSLDKLIYNVPAFMPTGGKVIDGSKTVSSGVIEGPTENKPGKITFTFPKAGTYKLICLVHGPMMSATVVVKPKTALVASPRTVAKTAASQTAAAWRAVKVLDAAAKPPANTVWAGLGNKGTIMGFYPKRLTVKAGTTVRFVLKAPMEIHDVAFGPVDYMEQLMKSTDLFPESPTGTNQVTPLIVYGTDPGKAGVYDGANHGNGFYVSPLLGTAPGMVKEFSITFTKPGTFHYLCLIHGPDMSGDIVVTS